MTITLDKGLDLLKKVLDVAYFLAELDGRNFQNSLLDFQIGIFRLKFVVVGGLEGHLDIAESQGDCDEEAEHSNTGQNVQDARWQLELS